MRPLCAAVQAVRQGELVRLLPYESLVEGVAWPEGVVSAQRGLGGWGWFCGVRRLL